MRVINNNQPSNDEILQAVLEDLSIQIVGIENSTARKYEETISSIFVSSFFSGDNSLKQYGQQLYEVAENRCLQFKECLFAVTELIEGNTISQAQYDLLHTYAEDFYQHQFRNYLDRNKDAITVNLQGNITNR